eukprot:9938230-Heterocapsa_arctica.AAC.1
MMDIKKFIERWCDDIEREDAEAAEAAKKVKEERVTAEADEHAYQAEEERVAAAEAAEHAKKAEEERVEEKAYKEKV